MEGTLTTAVASGVTARLVVEGANGPTTPRAKTRLHESGVAVVPDLVANAGGVIPSYFEWANSQLGQAWPEAEERRRVLDRLGHMWSLVAQEEPGQWRESALTQAIVRVVDRMRAARIIQRAPG